MTFTFGSAAADAAARHDLGIIFGVLLGVVCLVQVFFALVGHGRRMREYRSAEEEFLFRCAPVRLRGDEERR